MICRLIALSLVLASTACSIDQTNKEAESRLVALERDVAYLNSESLAIEISERQGNDATQRSIDLANYYYGTIRVERRWFAGITMNSGQQKRLYDCDQDIATYLSNR